MQSPLFDSFHARYSLGFPIAGTVIATLSIEPVELDNIGTGLDQRGG